MASKNNTLDMKVKTALLDSYVSQHYLILFGFILTAVTMVISLWESHHQPTLLWWLAGDIAAAGLMLSFIYFYKLNKTQFAYKTWVIIFCGFGGLLGLTWSLSYLLFIDPHNFYTLFIISTFSFGIVSGSLYTTSLVPPVFHTFLTPIIALYLFSISSENQLFGIVLGVFVFGIMLSFISLNIYRLSFQGLRNQYEKDSLSQSLQLEKEQVEKANNAKTRFLAAASHDLRQPLQAQRLFADAIRSRTTDNELIILTDKMLASQKSMQTMLDALLDISRLDASIVEPTRERISLTTIYHVLAEEYAPLCQEKGLEFHVFWPKEDAYIYSDRGLLESILRNLLSNALRYTQSGSIMLNIRKRGDHWRLEVRDSGIGIDVDKQHTIFDEFYQVDNPERDRSLGLGLGLSIVRRLCLLLDYSFGVYSKPNQGSVFSVCIPMMKLRIKAQRMKGQSMDEQAAHKFLAEDNLQLKHARVLIIDDDKTILDALAYTLDDFGWKSFYATNYQMALDIAKKEKPNVILSDYRLSGIKTGIDLIHDIRAQLNKDIPAMVMTGDTSPDRLKELKQTDFPVLHKPITSQTLKASLQQLLL